MRIDQTAISFPLAALIAAKHFLSHPSDFLVIFANPDDGTFRILDTETIDSSQDIPYLMAATIRFSGTAAEIDSITIANLARNAYSTDVP